MPKENVIQRTLKDEGKKKATPKYNVWVDGRWILYSPTFMPSIDVKEWGGRWEPRHNAWRLPRLTRMARKISEYDPTATMTTDVRRLERGEWEKTDIDVALGLDVEWDTHAGVKRAKRKLGKKYWDAPFQHEAVRALATRPYHGALLILSPGLGKTPISIVAGDEFIEKKLDGKGSTRIAVVTVLPLVEQWAREVRLWSSDPSVEVVHQSPPTPDRSLRWTVTNYDTVLEREKDENTGNWIVTGHLKEEWDLDWDVVIFDESVLLSNRKTKRVSACRTLSRAANRVWELSGAPIKRDNSDIHEQLAIAEPDYFTSFWRTANEFCIVLRTQWSQGEIMGSRKNISLRDEFPDLMFVRNQEEVFEDLPTYIYKDVELKLHPKQEKAHKDVLDTWIHELEENPEKRVEVTVIIAMLTRLQQITSNLYNLETTGTPWPDYSAKADFVEELLDLGDCEWPVLTWVHHRPGAHALRDRLQKLTKKTKGNDSALKGRRVELVLGGTKGADKIIEDFKKDKVDVLLLGITVGKYGHTLANAHTVITYDKTWDSDAWFQMFHRAAGARAKLAGFHHRPLLINPRCRGTVDDYVELNLAGKLPDMAKMTGADLAKILRSLGEEHVAS